MAVAAKRRKVRRQEKGARTRLAILESAVDIASVRGLEGLTVGALAKELRMSKSGLFAHFGSKEELQLATVDAARQIFAERVVKPALAEPKGLLRLWSLIDRWVSHVQRRVFAGGCFFTAASFEFDSRKGPVRDRIAAVMREWIGVLGRAVEEAQKAGDVRADVDAARLAHEIHSIAVGAHWANQLLDDQQAYARARTTMLERLRGITTKEAPPLA
jgi:AcrR family transcriptional regulator